MSTNPLEGMTDEFFEQILLMPGYPTPSVATGADSDGAVTAGMMLHIGTGGGFPTGLFPLGHSLDQGKTEETSGSGKRFCNDAGVGKPLPPSLPSTATNNNARESTAMLFPPLGNVPPSVRPLLHQTGQGIAVCQSFRPQPTTSGTVSHPPMARPKVRARRGQATDPHSIAERLRRERIAERMKQLQELVPNTNKTDRAIMLDEIMDYVKFLRLQVNVLSMSRIGGAGGVTQLVNIPSPTLEMQGESSGASSNQQQPQEVWDKWSADGTERQVAKLMEEDIGAAMQFLQSKDLCLMPLSLAMAIYHTHQPQDAPSASVKPEPSAQ